MPWAEPMVWDASEASGAWTNVSWSLKRFEDLQWMPLDSWACAALRAQMFYTEGDTLIPVPEKYNICSPRSTPTPWRRTSTHESSTTSSAHGRLPSPADRIVDGIEAVEAQHGGATLVEDAWERPGGGGGRTRVDGGKVWERGGVNFSQVEGEASAALKAQMNTKPTGFGLRGELVLHPNNPTCPSST